MLGGLFFGHAQPGMFTERAERILVGLAAQAAVAIDNSRLYQTSQQEIAARKASGRGAAGAQPDAGAARRGARASSSPPARESSRTSNGGSGFSWKASPTTRSTCSIPTGTIINWNPGAERIKGYAREEIIGQHFSRFYTDEDRQAGIPKKALGDRSATPASTRRKAGGSARMEAGSGPAS